jgi:glutamate-ammonia-ligase adenylyltransferase
MGYLRPDKAEIHVAALNGQQGGLGETAAKMCSMGADPDQGLSALSDLVNVADLSQLDPSAPWVRLVALLCGSQGLGRWLRLRPADMDAVLSDPARQSSKAIRADMLARVGSDGFCASACATDELRWAYRRHVMRIAARDLASPDPAGLLMDTCGELADLADATVEAALHIARSQVADSDKVRFAVVALGKTGAQELNYISDVDVLYVAEPAPGADIAADEVTGIATRLAVALTQIVSTYTQAGSIWDLDANLRPEGAAGPLVRTLSGMRSYYTKWASNWEFQAMLKARPMAGDLDLGLEFVDIVAPLVWTAAEREGFVAESQAMRARVVSLIPAGEKGREIKLGAGGLRDTEFSVQLLQLVHGRADERLRVKATLDALAQLVDHGYVSRADGAELDKAYRLQRVLEHRVQLDHMRRTHLMPTGEEDLRRLARSVGLTSTDDVQAAWRASAVTVQKLHSRLYYSPLLEAVARIPSEQIRLTPEAASVRLKALGYADPVAALRHIEALTVGMTRRAEMLRQLLPAMLGWIAAGPNPDMGLLAFRQVAEALGTTPWFLRALRDEGETAQDLATVLSSSRYASILLQRSPSSVELLVGEGVRTLPSRDVLEVEFASIVERHGEDGKGPEIVRATRRRELLRVAMANILDQADVGAVGRFLSMLTDVTIDAGLALAKRAVENPPRMAIIALGRWGGKEMSFSSDADLMVVLADSDDPDNIRKGAQILSRLRSILKVPGPDPDLELDTDLRPEGKDGPPVRTLSSYRSYYEKWSLTWEAQALLRARHGAGDAELSAQFLESIDPLRYPTQGLTPTQLTEIRRLKARMEAERIGRGIDPKTHVKLGPGGLSDVEWTVQILQMDHGHDIEDLQVSSTLAALAVAKDHDLLTEADESALTEAFIFASRIRNAIILLRGKGADMLPSNAIDLGQLAQTLGYPRAGGSHLDEAWRRVSRRARGVADRLFWGEE